MKQNSIFATVVSVAVIALTFVGCTKNEINPAINPLNENGQKIMQVQCSQTSVNDDFINKHKDEWAGYYYEFEIHGLKKTRCLALKDRYDPKAQCWIKYGELKLMEADRLEDMVGLPTLRVADKFKKAMNFENFKEMFVDIPEVVEQIEAGKCFVVEDNYDGCRSYIISTKPSIQDDDVEILHIFTFSENTLE